MFMLEGARHTARGQLVGRFAANGLSIKFDGAAGRGIDTGDQIEKRGLACPVGANHSIDNARFNAEGHILYGFDTAKMDRKVSDFEKGHGHFPRANLAASVGTSPLGIKIMQAIRMAPKATVSQPSNAVNACGSAVNSTAPTSEP